ncbi:MAG: Fe-S cluster assembly ATPase SufC [Candidatus Aenigmarchaeota archaeon]|nr:Fe-S cluster assembly ATPase SufC [Candidatus Aenigmarchaeota archaeon]
MMLEIKNLHVSIDTKEIVKGLDLTVRKGEIHAIMGPNGSGKSTLAHVLMGHPRYTVTGGELRFNGQDMLPLTPDKRARLGMFLAFQYPQEIEGLNLSQFLFTVVRSKNPEEKRAFKAMQSFREELDKNLSFLGLEKAFAERSLNYGFSGGEKKRAEILQLLMLKPEIAVLDETDSGLDIDSLQLVAKALNSLRGNGFGSLVITHYQRILAYLRPDFVHVMISGKIVKSGGHELAHELEKKGYNWLMEKGDGQGE